MYNETNELIAQFMGFTYEKNIGWYDNEINMSQVVYDTQRGNCFNELLFHEDWNWLITVIEKCLIGEGEHKSQGNKFINLIYEGLTELSKTKTYNACVEFIKWFNQQNK